MATIKRTVEVELSTTGMDAQGRPVRTPLAVAADGSTVTVAAPPSIEPELEGEHMLLNLGPQHPATHGVLRLVLELDGETVVRCIPHIGYLHCGFEKIGEYRQYNQIVPWTDREDYLNSIGNNVSFILGGDYAHALYTAQEDRVLGQQPVVFSNAVGHIIYEHPASFDPAGRQVLREAAYTLSVQCEARACLHLKQIEYLFPFAHGIQEHCHRAQVHAACTEPEAVRSEPL